MHIREQGTGNHLGSRPTKSKPILNSAGPNNLHQFIPAFGYPCAFQLYDWTFFFPCLFPKWTFHPITLVTVSIAYSRRMCNSVHPIAVRNTAGAGHCVPMALPGPHHSLYRCSAVHVLSETDVATCIKIETLLSPRATVLRDAKGKQYKTTRGKSHSGPRSWERGPGAEFLLQIRIHCTDAKECC